VNFFLRISNGVALGAAGNVVLGRSPLILGRCRGFEGTSAGTVSEAPRKSQGVFCFFGLNLFRGVRCSLSRSLSAGFVLCLRSYFQKGLNNLGIKNLKKEILNIFKLKSLNSEVSEDNRFPPQ